MKLPNPDAALIPFDKLEGYALNPDHDGGQHKAIVFQSALNIGLAEAEELRAALIQALKDHEAIPTTTTPYGQKYRLDFEMIRQGKTATIRSIWILTPQQSAPRLITCYIP